MSQARPRGPNADRPKSDHQPFTHAARPVAANDDDFAAVSGRDRKDVFDKLARHAELALLARHDMYLVRMFAVHKMPENASANGRVAPARSVAQIDHKAVTVSGLLKCRGEGLDRVVVAERVFDADDRHAAA